MVVAGPEHDLDLDAPEERRARVEDEAVGPRAEVVAGEVRDAAVVVGLARGDEVVAAEELDRDAARRRSPRSVSRTWVEMLTSAGIVFLAGGRARAVPDPLRGVIRPGADRARRGSVGRDRLRQADPRLHLGPDLLHPRAQPPAHRGGGALRARRGRPPELVDALRARPGARRAAGRALPGPARPRAAPQHRHGGERGRAEDGQDAHRPVGGRRPDAQLPRAPLRDRVRELLDGARGLRARAAGVVRHPGAVRLPLPGPPLRRGLRLHVPRGRLRARRPAVGRLALRARGRARALGRRHHRAARRLLPPGARAARRARDAAPDGRGPDGLRAPRDDVRLRARRRRARPRRRLEDARRRPAARRDDHVERDRAGLLRQGLPPRHLARLRSAARLGRPRGARRDRGGGAGRALGCPRRVHARQAAGAPGAARADRRRPRPRAPRRARAGRGSRDPGARRRARRRGHPRVLRARPLHEHRPLAGACELLPHRPAADGDGGRRSTSRSRSWTRHCAPCASPRPPEKTGRSGVAGTLYAPRHVTGAS